MTKRLVLSYLIITLIVLLMLEIPLGLFYGQRERERLIADVEHDANVIATLYEDDVERALPLDPQPAATYQDRTGARVVVLDRDGISLVDTDQPVSRDFSTRPEIGVALAGARASGTRSSETLGTDLLYVAVPVASGGTVHGALRITLDTGQVNDRIQQFWLGLVAVAAVVLLAVAAIGWGIARSVTRPLRQLNASASRFARGDLAITAEPVEGAPELRSLGETMNTMAIRLSGLLTTQRAFVADASHQLRTPLTALRLRLENLQNQLTVSTTEESSLEIDAAIEETNRLAELVSTLLQLARADERPETEVVDLGVLTVDRIDTWTAVADAGGVELRCASVANATTQGLLVNAVPGAIEQILDNLLDNALAVSPRGAVVRADVSLEGDMCLLTISDQGPGLSNDEKRNATRRFWRGDTTNPGTGLGLAIVDALATASGGSFSLADSPSGGLSATVSLVRVRDSAPDRGPDVVGQQNA
jgi:signal transduction histidine kinase